MSENRICPVCGYFIPSNYCPNCLFAYSLVNDEDEIRKAKKKFEEELILIEGEADKKLSQSVIDRRKYYLAGVLSSFVVGLWLAYYIIGAMCIGCFELLPFGPMHFVVSLFFLPIGILSGFIGHRLNNKYPNPKYQGWFILLSILMVPIIVVCALSLLYLFSS